MRAYYKIICITIIFILCLWATMLDLKPELFIGGDIGVRTAFPMQTLKDAVHMWNSNEGPGRDNTYSTTYIILSLFLLLLKIVGFSQVVFTKIFFFTLLFIAGMSAYFLILNILSNESEIGLKLHFCALPGALFYVFNYFSRTLFNNPSGHQPIVYSFFPLALLLFIKGLEKSGKKLYYAILFSIVSVFIFSCNLAHVGAAVIVLAIYFVYYISSTRQLRHSLKFVLLVGVFSIFLSAFIILPMSASLGLQENLKRNVDLGWFSMGSWLYSNSYFLDLFRSDGSVTYPPNFPIYKPVFIFFGYLLPIIAFSSLFWLKRNRRIPFFVILSLVGIFLAKGCQHPFGEVFYNIGKIFPPFTIFKYSYDKFSMLITISYAVMFSFSLQQYIKYWFKWVLFIAIIPIFICTSWPFIIGRMGTDCFFPKIPQSYYDAVDWINKKSEDCKVLSLPPTDGNYVYYNWGYFGQDMFLTLLNKPIMESARVLDDVLRNLIKNKLSSEFWRTLKLLNIKYILVHNDFKIKEYDIKSDTIENMMLHKYRRKEFGELNIFRVNHRFYRPHIYTSNKPVLVVSDEKDTVYPISCSKYLRGSPVLFFSKDIRKLKRVIKEDPVLNDIVFFNKDSENMGKWLGEIQRIRGSKPELLEDVDSAYILKGDGEFYIEKGGYYDIKAVVSGMQYLTRMKQVGKRVEFNNVDNFVINPCNVIYNYYTDESGILSIAAYFDGDSKEDEFVQIRLKDIKVDLMQNPYFYLKYKVENPQVQTIEVVIEVDINGDGIADDTLRGLYPQPASKDWSNFIINIYELVKERHPEFQQYNVVNLEFYPHKIWGVDCSKEEANKQYRFWIKEAGFYGYPVVKGRQFINRAVNIMDKLNEWEVNYNPVGYRLEEGEGALMLHSEKPYMEVSRNLDNIDINQFPLIELVYEIMEPDKIESIALIIGLDNKASIRLDSLPMDNGLNKYLVDIREILIDRGYTDECFLNKLILRIRLDSEVTGNNDIFLLKRARLCNTVFDKANGYIFKRSVFKIDRDTYLFGKKFRTLEDVKKVIFKKRIFLQKGEHYARSLIGENLEFIIIEPEDKIKTKPPAVVSFKRINSTRYEVKLNTDKSCWLVFSESFNPKWRAYILKKPERPAMAGAPNQKPEWSALWQMWRNRGKRIELKEHYMVNGYANTWYIDKSQIETIEKVQELSKFPLALTLSPMGRGKGEGEGESNGLNIVIEYIPQRFFELGCVISVVSLFMGGIGLIWIRKKAF